jgi:peptidoglycan hydrolase-like protein with peptidoglycan-binding domain
MSLPVLEKDDHQYAPSEWVAYAGRALREAGYLQSEPSGLYDEEFAAGVAAFQADHGISEENQVGPHTWAALGVPDTDTEAEAAEAGEYAEIQPGDLSEDGLWRWSGTEWVAAETAEPVAGTAAQAPAGNPEDAVEVYFNDDMDDPETDEAPAPDVADLGDIDALWRAETGER